MSVMENSPSGSVRMLQRLIVVALLVPALMFGAAAWKDRSAILDRAEGDGVRIVDLFREQAENLLRGHEIILDLVVDRVRDHDWDAIQASTDLLREPEVVDRQLDDASEILLVDANGVTRATSIHAPQNATLLPADRECFLALSKGAVESCISAPHIDPVSGKYLFSLARRLESSGVFNGVVQVAISADYIVSRWQSATPSATDIVMMLRSDGAVIAQSSPQRHDAATLLAAGRSLVSEIAKTDAGIIRGGSSGNSADRIDIYQKVAKYPIYISLSLDKNAVLKTWYGNVVIYGLVAAGATLGIVLALMIAIRRAQKERHAVSLWRAEVKERESAQEQLRQSQKMESLGQLTGGIAHDFNNLLQAITGNLELMQRNLAQGRTTSVERHVASAMSSTKRAAAMTHRLLAFSRKQMLDPKQVDANRLVAGMEDIVLRTVGPSIDVVTVLSIGLWPTFCDAHQLENALLNLAINARDAMPDGGKLTIETANTYLDDAYARAHGDGLAAGEYVSVRVTDTGTGMPPHVIERAFEPFYTTKPIGQGTGLGLSMLYGFAKQSGGHAHIDSEPNFGTTVRLFLPRDRGNEGTVGRGKGPVADDEGNQRPLGKVKAAS
jgi:signal transduction histidine kinase